MEHSQLSCDPLFHSTITFFIRKSAVVTKSLVYRYRERLYDYHCCEQFKHVPKPWNQSRLKFIMRYKKSLHQQLRFWALSLPRLAVAISLVTGATIALARPYVQPQAKNREQDLWSRRCHCTYHIVSYRISYGNSVVHQTSTQNTVANHWQTSPNSKLGWTGRRDEALIRFFGTLLGRRLAVGSVALESRLGFCEFLAMSFACHRSTLFTVSASHVWPWPPSASTITFFASLAQRCCFLSFWHPFNFYGQRHDVENWILWVV